MKIITKLLHYQGIHDVKLLTGIDCETKIPGKFTLDFEGHHDSYFKDILLDTVPEDRIAVKDRGFSGFENLQEMLTKGQQFVVRIKNNYKLNFSENENQTLIRVKKSLTCCVVNFYDLETKIEYRLTTNISGEECSSEEIGEIYRKRWQIETLWKFLKMYLKLDQFISKSLNGIEIQILMVMIAYLILILMEIPKLYRHTLLDKLR
jgi:IS4 transposase